MTDNWNDRPADDQNSEPDPWTPPAETPNENQPQTPGEPTPPSGFEAPAAQAPSGPYTPPLAPPATPYTPPPTPYTPPAPAPGSGYTPQYGQPTPGQVPPNFPPQTGGYTAPGAPAFASAPAQPVLASFGKRVQGWILDWFAIGLVVGIVFSIVWPTRSEYSTGSTLRSFVQFVLECAILAFLTTSGQTPGRKWAKTQLIDANGQPVERNAAFLRNLYHFLDSIACLIGWLWPAWDAKKQTFADKIAKTTVIDVSQTGPLPGATPPAASSQPPAGPTA